jgi:ferredoxin-type protein NapG
MSFSNEKNTMVSSKRTGVTRRDFLRYGFEAGAMVAITGALPLLPSSRHYVRPPGAADEKFFHQQCIKCGACVEACPTHALEQMDLSLDIKNLGTPVLNSRGGGCIAWKQDCLRCVQVCPTHALVMPSSLLEREKLGLARIDRKKCINCMLCFQKCPVDGAVLFPNPKGVPFTQEKDIPTQLKLVDSPLKPYVDDTKCVGCGICAHHCPAKTIEIVPLSKRGSP